MADLSRADLCIVGAGALGLALAKHARALGASVILVDRGFAEPGDGPQQSLRLAALKASASAAHAMRRGSELGLGQVSPKVSFRSIQERAQRLLAEVAQLDTPERLAALGIELVRGPTRFADPQSLIVGDRQVRAGAIVLAIGSNPIVPAIAGLEAVEAFSAESILETQRKLTHLLVIGGDASAFVLAQSFARLGSEVTLVPQGAALPGYDPEAAALLMTALGEERVRVIDGGAVAALQARSQGIGAVVELASGDSEPLDVSHVLLAMGGTADLAALDIEKARLQPRNGLSGLVTGELGQTANRRVRVVGAAAGVDQWQNALRHGRAVVESLVLGAPRHKLGPQPKLIATEPSLVQIGRLPGAAGKVRPGHSIVRASLAENQQAIAAGQGQGLVKVTTDPGGAIIGASLVGPGATEMAAVLSILMERGLALDALADLALPNPTLMSTLMTLGENYLASRPVPVWTARRRALRRAMPF